MQIRIGPPVSGANYFPRPDVEERLARALDRGHVSFMAPRRTGKTSTLIRHASAAPDNRPHWQINLETCSTPKQWLEALMEPFSSTKSRWSKFLEGTAAQLRRIEGVEVTALGRLTLKGGDWRPAAERFLDIVLAQAHPSTFLLDEFPILVDEMAKADLHECKSMLRWFRDWRQKTRETKIRFLVTGSIGLDAVVERHGLFDTVNDFESVDLPPLSREDAHEFLIKLSQDNGVQLDEACATRALELIGTAWPFIIQILVAELQELSGPIGVPELERVYSERLIAGPRNEYAKNMWNRLRKVFDPGEREIATCILDAVSRSGQGLTRSGLAAAVAHLNPHAAEDRLRFVLQVLEHDGYLNRTGDENRRVFFSNLLRDSWIYRNH